jgi:DNA modification methylase
LIKIIEAYSEVKNIIIDLFIGSGSTMVAAEQTDRICYGMELDPKYCAVILERMKGQGITGTLTDV